MLAYRVWQKDPNTCEWYPFALIMAKDIEHAYRAMCAMDKPMLDGKPTTYHVMTAYGEPVH